MIDYREILRMNALGVSGRSIALTLRCSRNTVSDVLEQAKLMSVDWTECRTITNDDLRRKLYPDRKDKSIYRMPDYEWVYNEMKKPGVNMTLLWTEYCAMCRQNREIPYQLTQFRKYYSEYVNKTKATMHITRKPAEAMEVDWAGNTAAIIDPINGEIITAFLFIATLPYSEYTYAEAFTDMKQASWINAHVHAYQYFGGVTRILVPDNLKTGVIKNTRQETILNSSYQEMAEHYGTAIVPARPRKPKDKPSAEGSVRIAETWILAALRNEKFFSLDELNQAIMEKLYDYNHKPFQKREGNRASAYEEEKDLLLPLPKDSYELSEWKELTVQYNYHITADKQNYSVPYEYIKKKVHVRLTSHVVEIFYEGTRIASHMRLHGRPNQYSTNETHMPAQHQESLQWNAERFIKWADKIGENTSAVVKVILQSYKIEQQAYKPCLSMLKLADKYSAQRLENACKRALSFTLSPSYKTVAAILKSGQDLTDNTSNRSDAEQRQGYTRGADYYRRID